MRQFVSGAALALAILSSPAAAAPARQFEPASQWQVDNEPQICRLSRSYQSGADKVEIRLEQFRPGMAVQATLIGDAFLKVPDDVLFKFKVRLGRLGQPFDAAPMNLTMPDGRRALLLRQIYLSDGVPANKEAWPAAADLARVDELGFTAPRMGEVTLQTKSLARAMEEMRRCHDRMLTDWGYDPAVQSSLSRQPVPLGSPGLWIRPKDYPQEQLRRRADSLINLRLDIDASGAVKACHVPRAFTPQDFSQVTCGRIIQKARFAPALDSAGQPVASYYVSSVTWVAF